MEFYIIQSIFFFYKKSYYLEDKRADASSVPGTRKVQINNKCCFYPSNITIIFLIFQFTKEPELVHGKYENSDEDIRSFLFEVKH